MTGLALIEISIEVKSQNYLHLLLLKLQFNRKYRKLTVAVQTELSMFMATTSTYLHAFDPIFYLTEKFSGNDYYVHTFQRANKA